MLAKTVSYTEARDRLAGLLDQAGDTLEPIIVTRRGKKAVAIIDAEELSSILETLHLLSSPANAKALFESLEEAKAGKAQRFQSVEAFIRTQRGKVQNRGQR